jgi:hypothetical protein
MAFLRVEILEYLEINLQYPGAPPHHLKKELADRKVPDRPEAVKGEGSNTKK